MTNRELVHLSDREVLRSNNQPVALASTAGSAAPLAVRNAITDLMIAFPAGAQQDFADKQRFAQLCWEACKQHRHFVIEQALAYLRFHNPRNPFAPTPQDVFELCNNLDRAWESHIGDYYFCGNTWTVTVEYDSKYRPKKPWFVDAGPEPGSSDCWVTQDVILGYLGSCYLRYEPSAVNSIVFLSDDHFARLPRELFTDEGYDFLSKEQRRNSRLRKEFDAEMEENYVRHRGPPEEKRPSATEVLR